MVECLDGVGAVVAKSEAAGFEADIVEGDGGGGAPGFRAGGGGGDGGFGGRVEGPVAAAVLAEFEVNLGLGEDEAGDFEAAAEEGEEAEVDLDGLDFRHLRHAAPRGVGEGDTLGGDVDGGQQAEADGAGDFEVTAGGVMHGGGEAGAETVSGDQQRADQDGEQYEGEDAGEADQEFLHRWFPRQVSSRGGKSSAAIQALYATATASPDARISRSGGWCGRRRVIQPAP